jgi:hypothetical protein
MDTGAAIAVIATIALDDLVIAADVHRHVVCLPGATAGGGIPNTVAGTRWRCAAQIARAVALRAADAAAAFESVVAIVCRATFRAVDDCFVAARCLVRIVWSASAALVAFVGQTLFATDAERAAGLTRAKSAGATLAPATREPIRACAVATAIAFLDDDAALLATARRSIRAAFAGRIAPVVI